MSIKERVEILEKNEKMKETLFWIFLAVVVIATIVFFLFFTQAYGTDTTNSLDKGGSDDYGNKYNLSNDVILCSDDYSNTLAIR